MPPKQDRHPVLQFLLTFAIVYLVTTAALRIFLPKRFEDTPAPQEIVLVPEKKTATMGRDFSVTVRNTTGTGLILANRCPEPPVIIERKLDDKLYQIDLTNPVLPCAPLTEIPAQSAITVSISPWKYAAFTEPGTYRISLPETNVATEVRVKNPGVFVSVFRAFISKPLLNGMILIASLLPQHSLGWSIIIITLIVKLLLFFPSQQALVSQKKLQSIQPKLDEIKRKHKGDQQRITEETMALWKKEKINPLQSCLPTFLQLPILLGLFFIIRDSSSVELAHHLLYPPFLSLDWTFATNFLGILDLKMVPFESVESWFPPHPIGGLLRGLILPVLIAIAQFTQMKMTFARKKTKKKTEDQFSAQNVMMYALPLMLIFISGSLPAAVSLYWGASTLFSIGQQMVVNRQ